jgi:hypothetical protein
MLVDAPIPITPISISRQECCAPYFKEPPQAGYPSQAVNFTMPLLPGSKAGERLAALHAIQEFATFESGWDGYGALPIHEATLKNATRFLNSLPEHFPCPDLTPDTNGTVSMEWESREGIAHLEIGKTRYSLYIKRHMGNPAVLRDGEAAILGADIAMLIGAVLYPPTCYTSPVTWICYTHPLHA